MTIDSTKVSIDNQKRKWNNVYSQNFVGTPWNNMEFFFWFGYDWPRFQISFKQFKVSLLKILDTRAITVKSIEKLKTESLQNIWNPCCNRFNFNMELNFIVLSPLFYALFFFFFNVWYFFKIWWTVTSALLNA